MPIAFTGCVRRGGRVRTKVLSKGRYIHICFIGGKSYAGEVHKKKTKKTATRKARKKIRKKVKRKVMKSTKRTRRLKR